MQNKTDQRINGSALESIMQEVLHGMQEFTSEACIGGDLMAMEILAIEKSDSSNPVAAHIIPFPDLSGT